MSTSGAGAAGSNTLTVKAGEYTYQLKGSPKAGWTQINFDNAGVEDHMMAVFRLKKGTTNAQFKKALRVTDDDPAFEKISASGRNVCGYARRASGRAEDDHDHRAHRPVTTGSPASSRRPTARPTPRTACSRSSTCRAKSNLKPPTDGVAEVTLTDTAITVPPGDAPKT